MRRGAPLRARGLAMPHLTITCSPDILDRIPSGELFTRFSNALDSLQVYHVENLRSHIDCGLVPEGCSFVHLTLEIKARPAGLRRRTTEILLQELDAILMEHMAGKGSCLCSAEVRSLDESYVTATLPRRLDGGKEE